MSDDELLDRLKAALAEPCVAVRLVHIVHGGCADFDVLDLLRLVKRVEVLGKMAGDAISEVANLRQAYTTATYNHPDDDMRILTLGMSEALINRGRKILGWDQKGET